MNTQKERKRIKSIRNLPVTTTEDKKEIKKLGKEIVRTYTQTLRAQAPPNLLRSIKNRCLEIKQMAKVLHECGAVGSLWDNASILLENPDEKEIYWLYQAPEEHFKIIVNRQFIPVKVGNFPIEPPADDHVDITFMEALPGHIISIDCTAWKREGAGAPKAA
jgi:hypothetical protein